MRPRDVIPFSPEAFTALFAEYNLAIWPLQLLAYSLGFAAVFLVLRPVPNGSRFIGAILAAFWLWTGIAYHWIFFARLNFLAPVFAVLFVAQGLLLAWSLVLKGKTELRFAPCVFGWAGLGLAAFALAIYPLLAHAAGIEWRASPAFGLTPCSLTIFTLGLLLLSQGRAPFGLAIVPLLWSLIGGSAALLLEMPQDYALPAAGAASLALMLWKNRRAKGLASQP